MNVDAVTIPAKRIVTLTGTRGGPPHARDFSESTLTLSRFISSPSSGRIYINAKGTDSFELNEVQAALELVKRDK